MREIPVPRRVEAWRYAKPISLSFLLLGLGIWLGSAFFPVVEIQVVERRVEVPVERLVEKRVPYEVIKYVDRVFEKRIEIPVDKVVYREPQEPYYAKYLEPNTDHWSNLRKGMTPSQVRTILGGPLRIKEGNFEEWFYSEQVLAAYVIFFDGSLLYWSPP